MNYQQQQQYQQPYYNQEQIPMQQQNYQQQMMQQPISQGYQDGIPMQGMPIPGQNVQQVSLAGGLAFEKLMRYPGIFVKQKIELLEAITGCETENKYIVFGSDKDGDQIKEKKNSHQLFKIKEKSSCIQRQCLSGSCRGFKGKVTHQNEADDEQCFMINRDYQCTFLCLNRPVATLKLTENGNERYLGKIVNPFMCCDLVLHIFDANDQMVYNIKGSCCQLGILCKGFPCKACETAEFDVFDANGQACAKLMKKSKGCLKSAFTDADNFSLQFPQGCIQEHRALLMTAVIMLDYMYFEEKAGGNQNN